MSGNFTLSGEWSPAYYTVVIVKSKNVCFVTSRRAVLKDCFDGLRKQIPSMDDRRSSHLDVLRMAVKYVQVPV